MERVTQQIGEVAKAVMATLRREVSRSRRASGSRP